MIYEFNDSKTLDFSNTEYPCKAYRFSQRFISPVETSTFYGYAINRTAIQTKEFGSYVLQEGQYFCIPGAVSIPLGAGIIIERLNYTGMFSIGGPIEPTGRLKYIDGCTDSLLIGPPRIGDPCLNHLHFPPGIRQTMHTHPSVRIGIVARGSGRCITPSGESPLLPGVCWYLPVDAAHCFYTDDESMDIIAWHPDTDTGPKDEDHPMVNRTMVDGVSANTIEAIRTK